MYVYIYVCILYAYMYIVYMYIVLYICILYMCFVDLEKAYDRVPRKMLEWALRKKGIPEVLVRSVMSLYEGAKTRVRVDSELSEEFEVKVEMLQGSVL